jgi:hypothetical protein
MFLRDVLANGRQDSVELAQRAEISYGIKQRTLQRPTERLDMVKKAFGFGKVHHREFAVASGEMSSTEFTGFLRSAMLAARNYSVAGSLAYYFMDWRHMREILSAGHDVYTELLNVCVWAKSNGGMGSIYRSAHELVFLFKNGTGSHRNNVQLGKFGRYRTNVWNYPGANSFSRSDSEENLLALHPTPKPVALIADAIKDCTARGDLILNPFLGSGTAIIAAERSGRRCYGLELDPLYVDTIRPEPFRSRIHLGHTYSMFSELLSQNRQCVGMTAPLYEAYNFASLVFGCGGNYMNRIVIFLLLCGATIRPVHAQWGGCQCKYSNGATNCMSHLPRFTCSTTCQANTSPGVTVRSATDSGSCRVSTLSPGTFASLVEHTRYSICHQGATPWSGPDGDTLLRGDKLKEDLLRVQ